MADLIDKSLAVAVVRQALVDAAHTHGSTMMKASSAMFKAEVYATNAIAALPAQGVRVKPLVWEPMKRNAAAWTATCPVSGHLYRAFDEADKQAQDARRIARILAALAPADAGGVEEPDIGMPISPAPVDALVADRCRNAKAHLISMKHRNQGVIFGAWLDDVIRLLDELAGEPGPNPYRLRPDLQRIVNNAKTALQWDTEHDRLTPAPVDALVKAAERMEVLSRSQMRTADYHGEGCNCYRCAEDALFAALAAYRGEK